MIISQAVFGFHVYYDTVSHREENDKENQKDRCDDKSKKHRNKKKKKAALDKR